MNKKIVLSILGLSLLGLGSFGAIKASAQANNGQYPLIIQKLAEKFGLKQEDIKSVFDQVRTDRVTQMQTKFDDYLSQAVKDGKLTEAQKQLILQKRQEIQAQRQTNMNNHQNLRSSLSDWAKQNNIPIQYLFGGIGMGRGFGFGHGHRVK